MSNDNKDDSSEKSTLSSLGDNALVKSIGDMLSNDPALVNLPYEWTIDFDSYQTKTSKRIRKVDLELGRGDTVSSFANSFMGFNHRIAPTLVPKNREHGGFCFFTRPDFNFNQANLNTHRVFKAASEEFISSPERAILSILDPECELNSVSPGLGGLGIPSNPQIPFDNLQAFIPILTNRCMSLTGFPDTTLDYYTSNEGLKREQFSMVDSHYGINYSYSLNATFANLDGDIITKLMNMWVMASSLLYEGVMIPRERNLVQNETCYQTRIYRLIMDPTLTYVTKIGCANACFPVNDNLGATMNYEAENLVVSANDNINIQFQCDGALYLDPILIHEFNTVVTIFNPAMLPKTGLDTFVPNGTDMVKLTRNERQYFNYFGYPRIDPQTKELQWWVNTEDYLRVLGELKDDDDKNPFSIS